MTDDKALDEIFKLDAERIQGELDINYRPCASSGDEGDLDRWYSITTKEDLLKKHYATESFLRKAPQMASLLRKQKERIKNLEEDNTALWGAVKAMFDDMRLRINLGHCEGHKDDDGTYVYPMGDGIYHRLCGAMERPFTKTKDKEG